MTLDHVFGLCYPKDVFVISPSLHGKMFLSLLILPVKPVLSCFIPSHRPVYIDCVRLHQTPGVKNPAVYVLLRVIVKSIFVCRL